MKGKGFSISGASGALPIWIDTSNTIVNSSEYKKGIQIADLAFINRPESLLIDKNLKPVMISSISGLPDIPRERNTSADFIETYTEIDEMSSNMNLIRIFEPFNGVNNENRN